MVHYHWMSISKPKQIYFMKWKLMYSYNLCNFRKPLLKCLCPYASPMPTCDALFATVTWRFFLRLVMSHFKLLLVPKELRPSCWKHDEIHMTVPYVVTGFIVTVNFSCCSVSDSQNAPMNTYLNSITVCLANSDVRLQTAYLHFVLCTVL